MAPRGDPGAPQGCHPIRMGELGQWGIAGFAGWGWPRNVPGDVPASPGAGVSRVIPGFIFWCFPAVGEVTVGEGGDRTCWLLGGLRGVPLGTLEQMNHCGYHEVPPPPRLAMQVPAKCRTLKNAETTPPNRPVVPPAPQLEPLGGFSPAGIKTFLRGNWVTPPGKQPLIWDALSW